MSTQHPSPLLALPLLGSAVGVPQTLAHCSTVRPGTAVPGEGTQRPCPSPCWTVHPLCCSQAGNTLCSSLFPPNRAPGDRVHLVSLSDRFCPTRAPDSCLLSFVVHAPRGLQAPSAWPPCPLVCPSSLLLCLQQFLPPQRRADGIFAGAESRPLGLKPQLCVVSCDWLCVIGISIS